MSRLEVLYNADCPICRREIAHFARRTGQDVAFVPVTEQTAANWGLSEAQALQKLHARQNGQIHVGIAAFTRLWRRVPGYRWLARVLGAGPLRPIVEWVYDHALAPALYALHLRRQRRADLKQSNRADRQAKHNYHRQDAP